MLIRSAQGFQLPEWLKNSASGSASFLVAVLQTLAVFVGLFILTEKYQYLSLN